jgi:hypothetical protein
LCFLLLLGLLLENLNPTNGTREVSVIAPPPFLFPSTQREENVPNIKE